MNHPFAGQAATICSASADLNGMVVNVVDWVANIQLPPSPSAIIAQYTNRRGQSESPTQDAVRIDGNIVLVKGTICKVRILVHMSELRFN